MSKKPSAVSKKSSLVAIVSDIHFDLHDVPTWRAFRKWHKEIRPDKLVVLGDFVDLGMMSHYVQDVNSPVFAIPQIKMFIKEMNEMVNEAGEIVVVQGNHDDRWDKLILGQLGPMVKDAIGLSLKEQCQFQGLDKRVKWLVEDTVNKGIKCGPFFLRHGHHQQKGKFGGGGKHLAANRIMKSLGKNEVFGHHHKVQMFCQTALDKTAIAIANGHMSADPQYDKDPDWQRGFTVLELYGPDNMYATPHPILVSNGHFSWNRQVFDGNI